MKFQAANVFACLIVVAALSSKPSARADTGTVSLGDKPLTVKLPKGWKLAEKTPEREGVLGAFQSEDNTSSLFVSTVTTGTTITLRQVLDEVVGNFEEALIVNWIGETKTGKLAGVSTVFTTLELDLPSAATKERKPFRFYLTVFELDDTVYLMQGSVQKPVNKEREQEILAIIRSLARK